MNKIVKSIAILGILLTNNLYAVDLSSNRGKNTDIKNDTSLNYNKNVEIKNSKTKEKSKIKTKSKTITEAQELRKIEQVDSLVALLALEKAGIKPFSSCRLLSKPLQPRDFGLSCELNNGMINEGKCSFLKSAYSNNYSLDYVAGQENEQKLKRYIACAGLYGGLIAQEMQTGKFNIQLQNPELKQIFEALNEELKDKKCKLLEGEKIACGSAVISFKGYYPDLSFAGISLFSSNNTNFYGYTSSVSKNKSKSLSYSLSLAVRINKSKATGLSKSLTHNQAAAIAIQQGAAANFSLSQFLPKE